MASTNLNTIDLMNSLTPLSFYILGIAFRIIYFCFIIKNNFFFDQDLTINKNDLIKGKILLKNIKDIKNNEVIFSFCYWIIYFLGFITRNDGCFPLLLLKKHYI